jgi:hypothetical protein
MEHDTTAPASVRNPFGVTDVPDPFGVDVADFAAIVAAGDASVALDGAWSSRWNGGADPTIPGDSKERWKTGRAEIVTRGDRVFIRFDWDNGKRIGLLEVRYESAQRLIGAYLNVTDPSIRRPWAGAITRDRITGVFAGGRLEFERG